MAYRHSTTPARAGGSARAPSSLYARSRPHLEPDEDASGTIEAWEAVAPIRPDTDHVRALRFLDMAGDLASAVLIVAGGRVRLRLRASDLTGAIMKTAAMKRPAHSDGTRIRDRVASLKASVSRFSPPIEPAPASQPSVSFATTVEAELIALNERFEAAEAAYQEAHSHEVELRAQQDPALQNARRYVTAHSLRISRTALLEALALPASSILALGLQARLIAFQVGDWWDEGDVDPQHALCRMLLDRLMGLAGVPRIRALDLTADELRKWIADPSTAPDGHRYRQGAAQ